MRRTVVPQEPDPAANWAPTLPASEARPNLLRNIHRQWQNKDQVAAATFAAEQGPSGASPSE